MTETKSNATAAKDVIMAYWRSWQDKDWDAMRRSLAPSLRFGEQTMTAEQFVGFCQQGSAWTEVELIDSLFTADAGALLYEGTDSKSGNRVRVGEIVRLEDGKVCGANACFGSGMPPQ